MDNQANNMMSEEVIEQMNESLVIDNETTVDEKTNLESLENRSTLDEKKIETEPLEEKADLSAATTTSTELNNTITPSTNNSNTISTTNSTATNSTNSAPSTTNTTTVNTNTTTTNTSNVTPSTELTESATETETKRTSQVKSFATVTASNTTNNHSTTTHFKDVSKVENKPLPNSNSQKNNQSRGGRQDQKNSFEREIFIKDVSDNLTREKLKEAFSKFGEVKKVDVFYSRHNGFIEFASVDSVKNALAAKSVIIDGHKVIAEEKHKRKSFNNSYSSRGRNEYRDSRGYQSGKNGNYVNRGKSIRSK